MLLKLTTEDYEGQYINLDFITWINPKVGGGEIEVVDYPNSIWLNSYDIKRILDHMKKVPEPFND